MEQSKKRCIAGRLKPSRENIKSYSCMLDFYYDVHNRNIWAKKDFQICWLQLAFSYSTSSYAYTFPWQMPHIPGILRYLSQLRLHLPSFMQWPSGSLWMESNCATQCLASRASWVLGISLDDLLLLSISPTEPVPLDDVFNLYLSYVLSSLAGVWFPGCLWGNTSIDGCFQARHSFSVVLSLRFLLTKESGLPQYGIFNVWHLHFY